MGRAMVARLGLGLLLLALLLPTQVRPWRPRGSGAAPCWGGGSEPPPGDRPAPPARAADWGCGKRIPQYLAWGRATRSPLSAPPAGCPHPPAAPGTMPLRAWAGRPLPCPESQAAPSRAGWSPPPAFSQRSEALAGKRTCLSHLWSVRRPRAVPGGHPASLQECLRAP